jgi:serine/threonine-protein kinase
VAPNDGTDEPQPDPDPKRDESDLHRSFPETPTVRILQTLAEATGDPRETVRAGVDGAGEVLEPVATQSIAAPGTCVAIRQLGKGSGGAVWLARDVALERDVALKLSRGGSDALLNEARVLARLEHAAVPPVCAIGQSESGPVVVMRRIRGVSLRELLGAPDHHLWSEWEMGSGDRNVAIVEILARVAEALAFAHEEGIVHRDVKPGNIVVGSLGQANLVDWGIEVPEGRPAAEVAGTPAFMAPEMVLGQPLDRRTDVFLLGATLHAAITGEPRHRGETMMQLLHAAASPVPYAYGRAVPRQLADLANEATAADPASRPPDALAFRDRLRAYRRDRLADTLVRGVELPSRSSARARPSFATSSASPACAASRSRMPGSSRLRAP